MTDHSAVIDAPILLRLTRARFRSAASTLNASQVGLVADVSTNTNWTGSSLTVFRRLNSTSGRGMTVSKAEQLVQIVIPVDGASGRAVTSSYGKPLTDVEQMAIDRLMTALQ